MRYRSKPVEIDAVLWTGDIAAIPNEWLGDSTLMPGDNNALVIRTLEGPAQAVPNAHYVVRGTAGEFYPVRRDIFEHKYTAVES